MSALISFLDSPANAIWAGAAFFIFVAGIVVAGIIQSGRGRDE